MLNVFIRIQLDALRLCRFPNPPAGAPASKPQMKRIMKLDGAKFFVYAVALASLAACGGGGGGGGSFPQSGGNGAGTSIQVTGTGAKGAALAGATVALTCANVATLAATTNGNGAYTTNQAALTYPCIGTAKSGAISYRGILFSGSVVNFTPLTDTMTEVVLAASVSGNGSLSVEQFISKIAADATFANNVSSASAVATYRAAALDVVKAQLVASGKSDADAEAILSAARSQNFDSATFAIGSDLDKVLDNTASVMQEADGSVKAAVLAAAKAKGDALPVPGSGATGGTGATGG
ncbi:hypothetical protein QTH97_02075 [Variovorax sp. J22R24]|uniref:hypothetical protein n=1 Tax=Variovorax gracilis TaxID=3053502 RepID=UPI002575C642|nr:hypothetical protein [Variovorax sp. J22R24]MDM0103703.1 hypothetical protein [Variovorax sp. J22R24]